MKYLFTLLSTLFICSNLQSQELFISEEQKTANSYIVEKYDLNIDSVEVLVDESQEFIQFLHENYYVNFYSVVMNNEGQIIDFYDCSSINQTEGFSFAQIAEMNTNSYSNQYALILFSRAE